ncbi:MAG: SAM-dependent methyltransferase [Pontixanthobacter sp.]
MIGETAPLGDMFRRLIRNTGPISLTHYMGESNARYYAGKDPLGRDGDFVTAPEISQMFGELIGLWLADIWQRAGRLDPVHYVELGPGRGTLAKDVLRAVGQHGLHPNAHLIETSPALKDAQRAAVPNATWHDDVGTVPQDGPILLVANEFLDALPIRQLVRGPDGWRERMVGLEQDDFAFVMGQQSMDAAIPREFTDAAENTILETCPAAAAILYEIAGRLAKQGGAALFIDYGNVELQPGSTFQAVRDHTKVSPFVAPGEADLTALVDFGTLARITQSRDARHLGTVSQGAFLQALGIDLRAQALAAKSPDQADGIEAARHRLVADSEMGTLFKIMGLAGPDWPDGAGFTGA